MNFNYTLKLDGLLTFLLNFQKTTTEDSNLPKGCRILLMGNNRKDKRKLSFLGNNLHEK